MNNKQLTVGLLFILVFLNANAQNRQTLGIDNVKQVLSTEIERMMKETGIPSLSIALIQNQELVWTKAFGYANVSTNTPATVSTTYSTGSTVKPFMAMVILQLVEKGLVDLDKPVNNYLKQPIASYSQNCKPITLRHLLSHQSGLPASAIFLPLWGSDKRKSLQEIASELKPIREPEVAFEYCNTGFVVCALVVESISGKSYDDYVFENILLPLELSDITFKQPKANAIEQMSMPYKLAYNQPFALEPLFSEPYPAGGQTYSTPSEMARFLIALLNHGQYKGNRLLSRESIEILQRTSFGHQYYGLGMGIEKSGDTTYLYHSGLQEGYTANFKLNLNAKTGVYVTANAAAEQHLHALVNLACELLEGKEISPVPSFASPQFTEITMQESELAKFVGSYTISNTDLSLTILLKRGKLYLQNPANKVFEIVPYAATKFYLKTEEEQLEFKEYAGKIAGLVLYSGSDRVEAKRIE